MKEKQLSFAEKINSRLSRELELPNLFTEADIQISASQGIRICGIEEVEVYTPERLVFGMRHNKLVINGDGLQIACCENGMAVLHGILTDISFTDGGAFVC